MKTWQYMFLFALCSRSVAVADDFATTITAFDPAVGITWSNTVTNAYSMLEWTPILAGVWNPVTPPGQCVTGFVGNANAGSMSNFWTLVSSYPGPLFFRIRSSMSEMTNAVETTRMRVANRTGNVVSNLFLQVKNHYGSWVDDWAVSEIQAGQTTEYNDFVIPWDMVMTDWVGYLSGNYQTTGQTVSVWLSPWPHYFTLVIDDAGNHKE